MYGSSQRLARTAFALGAAVAMAHCQRGQDSTSVSADCCEIAPNDTLGEGVGTIVVRFPGGAESTRLEVYAANAASEPIGSAYGDATLELSPGTYDVTVGGRRVENVAVRAGHATRVRAGVLHMHASAGTRIDLLDPSGAALTGGYGEHRYGLPIGTVLVQVAGQQEPALIEDDKITEF